MAKGGKPRAGVTWCVGRKVNGNVVHRLTGDRCSPILMFMTTTNTSYILISGTAYTTDTASDVAEAQAALREAGLSEAPLFSGDPDCPDSYPNGKVLFAD